MCYKIIFIPEHRALFLSFHILNHRKTMKLFLSQVIVFIATTKSFSLVTKNTEYATSIISCRRHKINETAVPVRYTLSLDNIITIIHRNYQ